MDGVDPKEAVVARGPVGADTTGAGDEDGAATTCCGIEAEGFITERIGPASAFGPVGGRVGICLGPTGVFLSAGAFSGGRGAGPVGRRALGLIVV